MKITEKTKLAATSVETVIEVIVTCGLCCGEFFQKPMNF